MQELLCGSGAFRASSWNVLTDPWVEVLDRKANVLTLSALEALKKASEIHRIAAPNPLDLFAAHRFLLTLLYWKADTAGGVECVRESLLKGEVPAPIVESLEGEAAETFDLFHSDRPFLQEAGADTNKLKSAGSFFAEFATGSNVAHFHHGDDKNMRLCLPCATAGILRLVPWTQYGGRGLSSSIHGAPPIMGMAIGTHLAATLGLNLLPLPSPAGRPKWSGHFAPSDVDSPIPYLEAFTWNPRRVHLLFPENGSYCWRCGRRGAPTVGQIVYQKNENTTKTKVGGKTIPFRWEDPAAFYSPESPYAAKTSWNENYAARGLDLRQLLDQEAGVKAMVVEGSPLHETWALTVPCTNPGNNKAFDHRRIELAGPFAEALLAQVPAREAPQPPQGWDGWSLPRPDGSEEGIRRFVHVATRWLTDADWAILSSAACKRMHESPGAFDLFSGVYWPLRKKFQGLPSKAAGWLFLKLMAGVPSRFRFLPRHGGFSPLHRLPRRQLDKRRGGPRRRFRYPISFPRGHRLETLLRECLDLHVRRPKASPIDWVGLCYALDRLLP